MTSRILILSASSGNGHVRAAEALLKAAHLLKADCEVKHIDALAMVSPAMRAVYSRAYIRMVNRAPSLVGWLYNHLDQPYKDEKRRLFINRLNALPLIKEIVHYQADLIICTHFLPADIVSILLERGRIKARHAVVITDLDAHAMWLTRNVDHYFVGLEETKLHLESMGVAPANISVTGIPIDPAFTRAGDKKQARGALGLPNQPTLLISAGGFGVGKIEELVAALESVKTPLTVLAMCGRNQALKKSLETKSKTYGNLRAIGYSDRMHDYMAAADIIAGKPGGLTTAEALSRGLIFVIVSPIPGQEERNASHLLEGGAAIRAYNLSTLDYKLERLLSAPERMQTMSRNALALSKGDAAMVIMRQLFGDLESTKQSSENTQPALLADRRKRKTAPLLRRFAR